MFDIVRPRLAHRPLAREGRDVLRFCCCSLRGKLILARRGNQLLELQLQLFEHPCRTLGARPVQSRLSFSIRSSRCAISAPLFDSSARALAATASACSASRSACSAARALARSDGRSSGFDIMKPLKQIKPQIQT